MRVARTNLTAVTTRFFGRAADMERLERFIGEGRRVMTLVGPAGAGKTRLAKQLAHARVESHEGGVWFCDLTEARDLAGVIVAVGHAVEAPLAGATTQDDAVERLARSIAGRGSTLLVMDNCEQVIDAAARVVTRIAELAPEAIQIATSRELLRVPGEQVHAVESLDTSGDATRLFVDRAQSVVPGYEPSDQDIASIVDIVRQLDGLPLAIELAAARMNVLGVEEIRGRLGERFSLLSHGPRLVAERQRTMCGAIDWSWDLLDPSERAVLAQCAVFRGGFGLAAAEGVIELAEGRVLDVLQSLCEKSLLSSSDATVFGERRYRLYETIRAYAFDELVAAGGAAHALERHMRYFATQGARWAEVAAKGESAQPRDRLAVELENLLAAHQHALGLAGAANSALTLLRPIAALLRTRGPIDLLCSLLDATLVDSITSRADPSLVGEALRERARAVQFAPDTAAAKTADLTRALELAHRANDVPLELACYSAFVSLELLHGRPDVARRHATAAIERARRLGDKRALAIATSDLGSCELAVGRIEEARASFSTAITLSRATDRLQAALDHARLCETLVQQGRLDEANACADDGFALASLFDAHRLLALLSALRGIIAHERGELARARERFDECLVFVAKADAELLHHFYGSCRASVLADLDDIEAATVAIEATEARLARFAEDKLLRVAVSISRGHLDLALARAMEKRGDAEAALRHRASAAKRISALDEAEPFEDLRVMRRRLERAVDASNGLAVAVSDEVDESALVVAENGSWFRVPKGARVELSGLHMCRLLVALTTHRIGASGRPLSFDEVFRYGWPGDQADKSSAANRVRVALARLRKLGMRDVLLTKSGYLLDPNVPIVIVRA